MALPIRYRRCNQFSRSRMAVERMPAMLTLYPTDKLERDEPEAM